MIRWRHRYDKPHFHVPADRSYNRKRYRYRRGQPVQRSVSETPFNVPALRQNSRTSNQRRTFPRSGIGGLGYSPAEKISSSERVYRRGSLVGRLTAWAIISPMRNWTRVSSISWLYPATRDTNRFSAISPSISSPHSPAEKSRSGLSGNRGMAHRLAPHQRDNLLTFVLFPRSGRARIEVPGLVVPSYTGTT